MIDRLKWKEIQTDRREKEKKTGKDRRERERGERKAGKDPREREREKTKRGNDTETVIYLRFLKGKKTRKYFFENFVLLWSRDKFSSLFLSHSLFLHTIKKIKILK